MNSTTIRAQKITSEISADAKYLREQGLRNEAFAHATSVTLSLHLIKALERIERLEGDIKVLTELLANMESSR
ncbi:hypothetical protein [Pseudomonas aeruginosa]|uniref:hypothetical protein n=1 Tax=Pseudomonas aeruginosa TaxID=287 RepID=UPI000BB79C83|nr:hypothetical protein [Pseudomonas aeruginosa]MBG4215914.1 hypothetical protein [Pseudomonas aeruginosa]MBO7968744.1 hypothetical protein [Pseudomonas aeruginosa]MCO3509981.1 hypothetical protein [Pseudomonas aeruginosa]PBZ91184.1 hypothetical protein CJU50_04515 [Pseudomonas aeruginosa]PBZ97168.1 hypothetical protein CJU49_04515 [Pseudomonas aeruginosa]